MRFLCSDANQRNQYVTSRAEKEFMFIQNSFIQQQCLLPNAVKILELLLVNPATTATPERSFSLARRIKTWLRSTSTAVHFNSLSTLHAHKSVTDSIDLVEVANEFTSKCISRKRIFEKF